MKETKLSRAILEIRAATILEREIRAVHDTLAQGAFEAIQDDKLEDFATKVLAVQRKLMEAGASFKTEKRIVLWACWLMALNLVQECDRIEQSLQRKPGNA